MVGLLLTRCSLTMVRFYGSPRKDFTEISLLLSRKVPPKSQKLQKLKLHGFQKDSLAQLISGLSQESKKPPPHL